MYEGAINSPLVRTQTFAAPAVISLHFDTSHF
jgi:hypothetical protein